MQQPQHRGLRERVAGYRARIQHERWDTAAWEALVAETSEAAEHTQSPDLLAEQKAVLEEFLEVFPAAALYWQKYADVEIRAGNISGAKSVFSRCLLSCLSVDLWRTYLCFIRQINEPRGAEGMDEVRKAYEFTLDKVGCDIAAGPIWQEYMSFLQGPAVGSAAFLALFSGGVAGQEETQRLTLIRRAFQRALVVPCASLDSLWRAYEQFEQTGSNRALARRILDEQRPRYQAAREAYSERARMLQPIAANALAVPPGKGGAAQAAQAAAWRAYIGWERQNAQRLDGPVLAARVALAYEQALMPLRHFPEVWLEFARWHEAEGGSGPDAAATVLAQGRKALFSCLLLHFAAADLEESRGALEAARKVYEELVADLVAKDETEPPAAPQLSPELGALAWVHYMRWSRRAESVNASRKLFVRCRKWPDCPWQVYVANALMEWQSERVDKIPRNIFELGLKSFLGAAGYVLAYADWLLSVGDIDNAKQLFERALAAAAAAAAEGREDLPLQQRLWDRYIQVEYQMGAFSKVAELEQRRRVALGDQLPTDTVRLALLKYRYMDLWPCADGDRQHLQQLLGVTEEPHPSGGVVLGQPPVQAPQLPVPVQTMVPGPAALPPQAALPVQAPPPPSPGGPWQPPPGGPHQSITQIPRELGNLMNSLPPVHALEGNPMDVDAVIEVLLAADLSPAALAASEAAALGLSFSPPPKQPASLPPPPVLRPPDVGPSDPRKRPWPDGAEVKLEAGGSSEAGHNVVPAHDVYRARRKMRTKASPLHG